MLIDKRITLQDFINMYMPIKSETTPDVTEITLKTTVKVGDLENHSTLGVYKIVDGKIPDLDTTKMIVNKFSFHIGSNDRAAMVVYVTNNENTNSHLRAPFVSKDNKSYDTSYLVD